MIVKNPLQRTHIDVMIPHALGVYGHDGTTLTNPEAIGQRAFNAARIAQFVQLMLAGQFGKALLQGLSGIGRGTIAMNTNENVTAIGPHRGRGEIGHGAILLPSMPEQHDSHLLPLEKRSNPFCPGAYEFGFGCSPYYRA